MDSGERGFVNFLWLLVGGSLLILGVAIGRGGDFFLGAGNLIEKTLGDIFVPEKKFQLAAEIDLTERGAYQRTNLSLHAEREKISGEAKEEKSIASKKSTFKEAPQKVSEALPLPRAHGLPSNLQEENHASAPAPPRCDFVKSQHPNHKVLLNEIAWMGKEESATDEWLELRVNGLESVSLLGWQILDSEDKIHITFEGGVIRGSGFYLLERGDDNTLASVPADKIYAGALGNEGEWLKIFNERCELVDEIDAKGGWPAGDNRTKKTLERNFYDFAWHTSESAGGTPKAQNSEPPRSPAGGTSLPPPPPPPPPQNEPPPTSTIAIGHPLFSEIMVGSEGNADNEFIELYNPTDSSIDLTGWSLKKRSSTGSESSLVVASRLEGKIIPAKKYFLLAHEGGYSGGAAPDILWPSSYSLAYTQNAVVIYNPQGEKVQEVSWAEISKDQSFERTSWDSNEFIPQPSPNPKNSQN